MPPSLNARCAFCPSCCPSLSARCDCRPSASAESRAGASPNRSPLCQRVLCGGQFRSAPVVLVESYAEARPGQCPSLRQPPAQHHATADAANLDCEILHLSSAVALSTARPAARLSVSVGPPSARNAVGEAKSVWVSLVPGSQPLLLVAPAGLGRVPAPVVLSARYASESERPLCSSPSCCPSTSASCAYRPSASAESYAEASPYQRPLCQRVLCGGEFRSAPVVLSESYALARPGQCPSLRQPPAQHHATADAANLFL